MTWYPDSTGFVPHVTERRFNPETGRPQHRTRLIGDYSDDAWSNWIDDQPEATPPVRRP